MKTQLSPFLVVALSGAALALTLGLLTLAMPTPAQAFQTGRSERAFCFNSPGDYGIGRICDFDTYAQCLATQSGINGTCERNPWYAYGEDEPPRYPVARRPRY
jgi:hypothetical protein